jgi:hypothetical protein
MSWTRKILKHYSMKEVHSSKERYESANPADIL